MLSSNLVAVALLYIVHWAIANKYMQCKTSHIINMQMPSECQVSANNMQYKHLYLCTLTKKTKQIKIKQNKNLWLEWGKVIES